jgi:hypothetical protein
MITDRQDRRVVEFGSPEYHMWREQGYKIESGPSNGNVTMIGPLRLNSKADFAAYRQAQRKQNAAAAKRQYLKVNPEAIKQYYGNN